MSRTLLLGTPETTWRPWLKTHREDSDLLILDPGDPDHGHLGRLVLFHGDKIVATRFYGSLDPARAPHLMVAGLAQLLALASENLFIQLFPLQGGPLLRHTVLLLTQLVQPDDILVPNPCPFDLEGFPVGPNEVELEASIPEEVRVAQRKANWLKMLERCEEHEVALPRVAIEGARLGSGRVISREQLSKVGIEHVLHAEVGGGTLFLISDQEVDDHHLPRALDVFHCGRVHVIPTDSYEGLLCAFARQSGEDFGMGMIQSIDFETKTAKILCDAVPPAPVRILKIGGMRIDSAGRELGEVRPWQV